MPFLAKVVVTAQNVNGETVTHQPGTVLSDWELEPYARQKILEGSEHYRRLYEPLTDREAAGYRIKATSAEPPHTLNGALVNPPWNDYVGLHPTEIVARMRTADVAVVQQARQYEQADGGMRRSLITGFVHSAEREPFLGFDGLNVSEIWEKFELLPDDQVEEAKTYERAHQNRPAIAEWERETKPEPVAA